MLVPKLVIVFGTTYLVTAIYFVAWGGKRNANPPKGWRFSLAYYGARLWSYVTLLSQGYYWRTIEHGVDDVDYSKYLGEDWKKH